MRRDLDALAAGAAEEGPAEVAATDPATPAGAGFTDVPHTPMRRAIARRLTESASTIPDFQLVAHCRVHELMALCSRVNEISEGALSINDFVVKAVAGAMVDVPDANAVWTDAAIRRFSSVDLAIAVSVPSGLVTPVVRGVERMSMGQLGAATRDLAARAREGRLRQHELEGGSFSVSNLGMYGTEQSRRSSIRRTRASSRWGRPPRASSWERTDRPRSRPS